MACQDGQRLSRRSPHGRAGQNPMGATRHSGFDPEKFGVRSGARKSARVALPRACLHRPVVRLFEVSARYDIVSRVQGASASSVGDGREDPEGQLRSCCSACVRGHRIRATKPGRCLPCNRTGASTDPERDCRARQGSVRSACERRCSRFLGRVIEDLGYGVGECGIRLPSVREGLFPAEIDAVAASATSCLLRTKQPARAGV